MISVPRLHVDTSCLPVIMALNSGAEWLVIRGRKMCRLPVICELIVFAIKAHPDNSFFSKPPFGNLNESIIFIAGNVLATYAKIRQPVSIRPENKQYPVCILLNGATVPQIAQDI